MPKSKGGPIALGRVRERDEDIQEEIRKILPLRARLLKPFFPRLVSAPGLYLDRVPGEVVWGTDLGNVSQVIPAIHPMIGLVETRDEHPTTRQSSPPKPTPTRLTVRCSTAG